MDGESRRLVPLREAAHYRVSADMPDVRGWDVEGADGALLGRVTELLVDLRVGRVRYLELETAAPADGGRHVHLPIGLARLDVERDVVVVPTVTTAVVGSLTTLSGQGITRDYEVHVRRSILGAEDVDPAATDDAAADDDRFYAGEPYDERRFAGPRRRRGEPDADPDRDDDDFTYLAGVGGAMTDDDVRPEVVGELDAGQISVPVMQEEAGPPEASEERRAARPDERSDERPADLR